MVTSPRPDSPTPAPRRLPAARALWRVLAGRTARLAAGVHQTWRRSLQVRVVTITLVASSLLVGGFAYLIADKLTNILLENAETDVLLRLQNGSDYASKQFNLYSQPQEAQLQDTIDGTVNYLAGGDPAQTSGVVVAITADNFAGYIESRTSPDVQVRPLISRELRASVAAGNVAHQVRTGTLDGQRTKYLVYGSPVPTRFGQLELYYLVPLARQDATAADARATVVATGAALVLLLGLLAALVTRLVVTPVAGRRPHRPATLRRPARPADGGQRRGRPGPARRLVQPDGDQPATADPPAGGDVPAATPVHLRRLPRTADPADHGPDGRRPDLRRAGRVRPGRGAQRRAAPG